MTYAVFSKDQRFFTVVRRHYFFNNILYNTKQTRQSRGRNLYYQKQDN